MRCVRHGARALFVAATLGCARTAPPPAAVAPAAPPLPVAAVPPAPPPCPPASILVDRWVARMGGRAAVAAAAEGFRAWARVESDTGPSGELRIFFQAPSRVRSVFELPSGERYEDGVDGDLVWSRGPDGVQLHDGEAAASSLRRADLFAMALRYPERFPNARCRGSVVMGGGKVWVVEAEGLTGEAETHLFSADAGRLVGVTMDAHTPLGRVRIETRFLDFRRVGTLELSFEQVHRAGPLEQRLVFERLVFVPPDEEDVAAPAEVREWAARGTP